MMVALPQSHPPVCNLQPLRGPSPESSNLSLRVPSRRLWQARRALTPPVSGCSGPVSSWRPLSPSLFVRQSLCTHLGCTGWGQFCEADVNSPFYTRVKKVPESLGNTPEVTQPASAEAERDPSPPVPCTPASSEHMLPECLCWLTCICVWGQGRVRYKVTGGHL